ncbi:NADP-dependent oxidoreductase [Alkalicaulis satelles]|uniref:NADP-dependent oxidoreductase n=1 Tax=Alkalicaulis satelles TaxID=2609175 RepID=A0A5M6ZK69_9PROT|nr:NADP-dependent oxidoreductase [Alkalicaulis satelles]KAA5805203.1 NADP-dependent oxidoreductase [Alkalicaulis satelles]
MKSREIRLVRHFTGPVKPDYFELAEVELPEPGAGEVRVRNAFLSVDPYMRGRMIGVKTYVDPFQPGQPMDGGAVGQVVDSKADGFAPGDWVMSMHGWREGYTAPAAGLMKIDASLLPAQAYLGIAGMPGLTAYAGLKRMIGLKEGETLWMSAGAGAVGTAGIQFAKAMGAHVIATAGGPDKTAFCRSIGADAVVDYKAESDLAGALRAAAKPFGGIDAYYENVGGDHLQAALDVIKPFGRIAACGMIARYNDDTPAPGPSNLTQIVAKKLTIRGFIVTDHFDMQGEFIADLSRWIGAGQVRLHDTVYEGIERTPDAFMGLFTGANTGKMLVKL